VRDDVDAEFPAEISAQLMDLRRLMVQMARLAGAGVSRATEALLQADLSAAEAVISGDLDVDALQRAIEDASLDLLVAPQAVGTDLRIVASGLRITAELERMGDLARHVAKLARLRYPDRAVPADLGDVVRALAQHTSAMATQAGEVIASQDVSAASALERADEAVDRLHRQLFSVVLGPDWPHGVQAAVDVTLVGRYYERFADHAVSVARTIAFVATGHRSRSTAPR
jgi:phosphate transport system protein